MAPWMQYLIVCPLVFLGGFVDAIAGGGGLISLPAYLIAGLPVHMSIGTNKLSSAMGTTVTTVKFWRAGYMRPKLCLLCAAFALAGSAAGANLALLVGDRVFRVILLFVLPLTALYVFKSKAMDTPDREPLAPGKTYALCAALAPGKTYALCAALALSLGVYDGFYGPGTGTFLLLLLTGLARLSLHDAAGATKAINLATNVAALATYLVNGQVWLPLGLTAGLFGVAGNYIGARCFTSRGSRIVKPLIALVLTIFFIRVVYETFF